MAAERTLSLYSLTGLEPDHLARVFAQNPRAYMAVKGAVAEEHLVLHLAKLQGEGKIISFLRGQNDNEKDFYVTIGGRTVPITIECKNVQVIAQGGQKAKRAYLEYLIATGRLEKPKKAIADLDGSALDLFFKRIPQWLRESGLPRYEYSTSLLKTTSPSGNTERFLAQFDSAPLTVDFQKTRNSEGVEKSANPKARRFYTTNDFDIVAACLFSRTLNWEFLFAASRDLEPHPKHAGRVHNKMVVSGSHWSPDLLTAIKRVKQRR